jgi:hypothetical protein
MRIAYVLGEDLDKHAGLRNKVDGQIGVWKDQGHEVYTVFHALGVATGPDGKKILRDEPISSREIEDFGRRSRVFRLHALREQYCFLGRALETIAPELSYARYSLPYFGARKGFGAGGPLVFEVNSDDREEYGLKSRMVGMYNRGFRKTLLSAASGLVFVTEELLQSNAFHWYSGSRTVVSNGVIVETYPFCEAPGNERPKLCFIGSSRQLWHGIEKLGSLAAALPESEVHVIGPNRDEYIRASGREQPNMHFHGFLEDRKAKDLVKRMDVGIGPLSMYENGMDEGCSMKTRQYLAQGIPVICGNRDTDIDREEFYLELPNRTENVQRSIGEIRRFVELSFRNRALRHTAREFALAVLDCEVKEGARLRFFEDVLEDHRG